MKPKIRVLLAEVRRKLKTIYGPRLVRLVLFGSQSRGDARVGSDIDILVVLRRPVDPGKEIARTGKAVASLSLKYDAVVSCSFVSDERYAEEESPLLINVRDEGLPI